MEQSDVLVSFGKITSEDEARQDYDAGRVLFVEPEAVGGIGKIFVDGQQYGGGGSGDETKFPSGTTTSAALALPVGTDISGKSAYDILRMILVKTYKPFWEDASVTATALSYTRTRNGVSMSSQYFIVGTSASPATIKSKQKLQIVGKPAKTMASPTGEASGVTAATTAKGGDLTSLIVGEETVTTFTTNSAGNKVYEVEKEVTKSISTIGVHTLTGFTSVGKGTFAAGTETVKDSAKNGTNYTASTYENETGNKNGLIKDGSPYNITSIDKYCSPTTIDDKVYGYLPIYAQTAVTMTYLGATAPSGSAVSTNTSTALALSVSNGAVTNGTEVSAQGAFECEAYGRYFKATLPESTKGVGYQMLLPDGYEIDSYYSTNANNNLDYSADQTAFFAETSTTYTLHGYTYKLWQFGTGGVGAAIIGFRIKKKA